jgi:hypothetical protein
LTQAGKQAFTNPRNTAYLERFYDPGLELPEPPLVREHIEAGEVERIQRALAVVVVAGTIPRRLGGDATADELAQDKKRCRRVSHALSNSIYAWTKKRAAMPEVEDEIRIKGAQLNWTTFKDEHVAELMVRQRLLATWAVRNEERRWGKTAIVHLENELNWFLWALRD